MRTTVADLLIRCQCCRRQLFVTTRARVADLTKQQQFVAHLLSPDRFHRQPTEALPSACPTFYYRHPNPIGKQSP
jgi:hypothetical protein